MRSIHVLRKPCAESTVAANVLRHGTGAVNVDGCRVGYENTQNPATNPLYRKEAGYKNNNAPDTGSSSYSLKDGSGERNPHTGGRWPANLILQHLDGCWCEGGTETVAAWTCAPGCPVAGLDEQSGELQSGDGKSGNRVYENECGHFAGFTGNTKRIHHTVFNDTGGASRFFKQVKP
jgi:hypothetical protein